jgi:hypothetical protein
MEINQLDEFTLAYIECALWSSTNPDHENDPSVGECLDHDYGVYDIAPETLEAMVADCQAFQKQNAKWLVSVNQRGTSTSVLTQAGHDFWLTRNGHGAGFWDGDWSHEAGKALTESSKRFGSVDLYPAEGKVYSM